MFYILVPKFLCLGCMSVRYVLLLMAFKDVYKAKTARLSPAVFNLLLTVVAKLFNCVSSS